MNRVFHSGGHNNSASTAIEKKLDIDRSSYYYLNVTINRRQDFVIAPPTTSPSAKLSFSPDHLDCFLPSQAKFEMSDSVKLLDLPAHILEKVVDNLQRVGIQPSPFHTQIFLLVLVLVALVLLIWVENKKTLRILTGFGLGLIAFGIVFSWVEQLIRPFPDEIAGRIEVMDRSRGNLYAQMRVKLLDYRGKRLSLGSGRVDTTNGRFSLSYTISFGNRPRTIRVAVPGCQDQDYPIERTQLRSGGVTVQFLCEGKS